MSKIMDYTPFYAFYAGMRPGDVYAVRLTSDLDVVYPELLPLGYGLVMVLDKGKGPPTICAAAYPYRASSLDALVPVYTSSNLLQTPILLGECDRIVPGSDGWVKVAHFPLSEAMQALLLSARQQWWADRGGGRLVDLERGILAYLGFSYATSPGGDLLPLLVPDIPLPSWCLNWADFSLRYPHWALAKMPTRSKPSNPTPRLGLGPGRIELVLLLEEHEHVVGQTLTELLRERLGTHGTVEVTVQDRCLWSINIVVEAMSIWYHVVDFTLRSQGLSNQVEVRYANLNDDAGGA